MQYKNENEKVVMMDGASSSVSRPFVLSDDFQIRRTRTRLIIILGILIALNLLGLMHIIIKTESRYTETDNNKVMQSVQGLISILLFGFGIFAAYRYSTVCLHIFAWVNVIRVIGSTIYIIVLLLHIGNSKSAYSMSSESKIKEVDANITMIIILLVVVTIITIVVVGVIVMFSFKLARLIDNKKHPIDQQI